MPGAAPLPRWHRRRAVPPAAGPGDAHLQRRAGEDAGEVRRRRAGPDEHAGDLVVHAADPGEFSRIEAALRDAAADQRLHGNAAADDRDLAAVARRGAVEII